MASGLTAVTSPPISTSKKRRFQVPITNYFSSSDSQADNDQSSRFNYSAPTYSAHPTLPHKIQSSLLNVGMRVRKAVPGGYQTTTTKPDPIASYHRSSSTTSSSSQSHYPTSTSGYSELTPICGILKVGNFAVQSYPQPSRESASFDLDDESIPFSSQESTDSAPATISGNPHKRRWEQEQEDESEDDDGTTSGTSPFRAIDPLLPTAHPLRNIRSRPILYPRSGGRTAGKSSRTTNSPQNRSSAAIKSQNNSDIHDFEDAPFLRSKHEVDGEVEMGGM